MSDRFDPYRDWLHLPGGKPSTLYELLGVERFEPRHELLDNAAKRRLEQLSEIDPGQRLDIWEALCREIVAARDCLCQEKRRSQYDASLRHPMAPVKIDLPPMPARLEPAGNDSIDAIYTSGRAEFEELEFAHPAAGVETDSPNVVDGVAPATTSPENFPIDFRESTTRKARRRRRAPANGQRIVIGLLGTFIVAGSLFVWLTQKDSLREWWRPSSLAANGDRSPDRGANVNAEPHEASPNSDADRHSDNQTSIERIGEPEKVEADIGANANGSDDAHSEPIAPATVVGESSDATQTTTSNSKDAVASPPAKSLDSPVMAEPSPSTDKRSASAGEPPPTAPARELAVQIQRIRAALRGRQPELARQIIAETAGQESAIQEQARLDRERELVECVAEFWRAVRERMTQLPPTSELTLRDEPVVVVESSSDSLTLRAAGRNHRYTQSDLPFDLAMLLASMWFDPAVKSNGLFLGAAHFVEPQGDREATRRLWNEAVAAGATTTLLPLLDEPLPESTAKIERIAIPDKADVAEAIKVAHAQFAAEYKAAKSPTTRSQLARQLLAELDQATDDVERYALLVEARNLAVRGDDAALLLSIVDATINRFIVDDWKHRCKAFELAAKDFDTASAEKLSSLAIDMAQHALAENQAPSAASLLKSASLLAKRAKATALQQRVQKAIADLRAASKPAESAAPTP